MNKELEIKKEKYEKLAIKVKDKYKSDMKSIKSIIEVIENNSEILDGDSLETIVFKKYLEVENVKKVADHINLLGYRIKTESYIGERKYTSNDISRIIASDETVEIKLRKTVKELHYEHSMAMVGKW